MDVRVNVGLNRRVQAEQEAAPLDDFVDVRNHLLSQTQRRGKQLTPCPRFAGALLVLIDRTPDRRLSQDLLRQVPLTEGAQVAPGHKTRHRVLLSIMWKSMIMGPSIDL